jgi:hypothetical protein
VPTKALTHVKLNGSTPRTSCNMTERSHGRGAGSSTNAGATITKKFFQCFKCSEGNNHGIITLDILQSNKASRRCLHGSSSSLMWFFKHSEGSRFCLTTQSLLSKHSLSASSSGSHTPRRVVIACWLPAYVASDMHRLTSKSVVLCHVYCC